MALKQRWKIETTSGIKYVDAPIDVGPIQAVEYAGLMMKDVLNVTRMDVR